MLYVDFPVFVTSRILSFHKTSIQKCNNFDFVQTFYLFFSLLKLKLQQFNHIFQFQSS